jgi:hypothetical protein
VRVRAAQVNPAKTAVPVCSMASYKYRHLLSASEELVFDNDHQPGDRAKLSGIYRCPACGRETVVKEGDAFPTDHGHAVTEGPVRWRLLVYADHRAK